MKIEQPEIEIVAKQAFITRQQPLLSEVCAKYGRDPSKMCVKVFYGNPLKEGETLEDALWGDNHDPNDHNQVRLNCKLMVGSKIQNLFWLDGISPRVYAVFEAEFRGMRVACQLTDFAEGEEADDIKKVEAVHNGPMASTAKYYHFSEVKDILSKKDMIGNKIVDVQQYTFNQDAEERVKEIYFEKGRYGKVYYQEVPELGLHGGPRKSLDRVGYMKLETVDFTDKVVWDLGCAGGFFCRYALDRGAKIVYGIDEKDPVYAAFVVSNYLGKFNIDYREADLRNDVPSDVPKPDIVFFLSMNYHIEIPKRLFEAELVIFEDNGKTTRQLDTLGEPWTNHYSNIQFVGRGLDHGDKACYILRR